jgi:hypothetical protein
MLAVLVGAVLGGRSSVEITSASFGMPLAWLTGWMHRRSATWGYGVAQRSAINPPGTSFG